MLFIQCKAVYESINNSYNVYSCMNMPFSCFEHLSCFPLLSYYIQICSKCKCIYVYIYVCVFAYFVSL